MLSPFGANFLAGAGTDAPADAGAAAPADAGADVASRGGGSRGVDGQMHSSNLIVLHRDAAPEASGGREVNVHSFLAFTLHSTITHMLVCRPVLRLSDSRI